MFSTQIDSLYSYELKGGQAAINYLLRNQPAEPEMWITLYSKKIAWTCSRTKRYNAPTYDNVCNDKISKIYCTRLQEHEQHNVMQWLRLVNTNDSKHALYKHGTTLIGTKIVSIFNPQYFFQNVVLHDNNHLEKRDNGQ